MSAFRTQPLVELGQRLMALGYEFTTVTPTTQRLVNSRPGAAQARSLRDIFGWSRPFLPEILPSGGFELLRAANACEPQAGSALWRPLVRFSSMSGLLFAHSAFPTRAADAVFFGPDSHRFVRALKQHAQSAQRIVDVGCGSGVGGIVLVKGGIAPALVLSDINAGALCLAEVNAQLSGVSAEILQADVLDGVPGEFALVIANPPYLRDEDHRLYRDGGGSYGEALGARIVREALSRLRTMPGGGTLLLYTGAAVVEGEDTFRQAIDAELRATDVSVSYEELDPDVFSDELERPAYAEVERIAAVFLTVRVDGITGYAATPR